jgi:hypothetical protein
MWEWGSRDQQRVAGFFVEGFMDFLAKQAMVRGEFEQATVRLFI